MSEPGWSNIAVRVEKPRDVANREGPVYGVALHTTGSGVVRAAKKKGIDPIEWAIGYYTDPDSYAPHYVIDFDGTVYQVANEVEKMPHIGLTAERRKQYLSGAWKKLAPPALVARWQAAWPGYKSPAHLYPGSSPNGAFVGVEMIPITGTTELPMAPGLLFTQQQHALAAGLACDIATRNAFPPGWSRSSRLVGHEDVGLLDRMDKGGGWDPGALRERQYFDMVFVRKLCAAIDPAS